MQTVHVLQEMAPLLLGVESMSHHDQKPMSDETKHLKLSPWR